MTFSLSEAGIYLIEQLEGFKTKPYFDTNGLLTVGIGHLINRQNDPNLVKVIGKQKFLQGQYELTKEQVENLFILDAMERNSFLMNESYISEQCHFDALFSFMYNIGQGAYKRSSLRDYLQSGGTDKNKISQLFLLWTKNKVLTKRRAIEVAVFTNNVELAIKKAQPIAKFNIEEVKYVHSNYKATMELSLLESQI